MQSALKKEIAEKLKQIKPFPLLNGLRGFDLFKPILVYTDGSCLMNPGPGGWAFLALQNGTNATISGYMRGAAQKTTNNRMELMAVIGALHFLKEAKQIQMNLDSQYSLLGITQWRFQWKKNNWHKADKKPVLNADLWQALDQCLTENQEQKIQWNWIRGHNGDIYNEICDFLAHEMSARQTKI